MFFVSKKKYNALLEQKKDFERIATNAVAQNGRLLEEWDAAIKEMRDIQKLNLRLVEHNDELLAHCKELEAKLAFVIKQRDYYYDLLEDTSEMEEKSE
jgi:predicted DCC family thiol-disulfide oxidoreductase YuxK